MLVIANTRFVRKLTACVSEMIDYYKAFRHAQKFFMLSKSHYSWLGSSRLNRNLFTTIAKTSSFKKCDILLQSRNTTFHTHALKYWTNQQFTSKVVRSRVERPIENTLTETKLAWFDVVQSCLINYNFHLTEVRLIGATPNMIYTVQRKKKNFIWVPSWRSW